MCLYNRQEVQISEAFGFKLFTERKGELHSAFRSAYKNREKELPYPPHMRIKVAEPDTRFFAFKRQKDAISLAREGRARGWILASGSLIVLPVIMYNVVAKGTFFMASNDPQCMDGYAPAMESTEIMVMDEPGIRDRYFDNVIQSWWRGAHVKGADKEALMHRLRGALETL